MMNHRQLIDKTTSRNSGCDESMMAYLERKNKTKNTKPFHHNQQQQESVLDIAKFNNINKCSSYIDRQEQYILANMLVNNVNKQQSLKKSSKKIKKLGQCISSKFKKLIALSKANEETNSIRLVNFNYKETEANVEQSVRQLRRKPSLRLVNTDRRRNCQVTKSRTSLHSNGSTSSGSSKGGDEPEHDSSQLISHLFSPQCVQMGLINRLGTSTPLTSTNHLSRMPFLLYDTNNNGQCTSSCCCDQTDSCSMSTSSNQAINMALFMDQSTQVPVDSPVLIESTFNNSSLSNLSDDLIIVQQQQQQTEMVVEPTPMPSYRRPTMSASMRPQNGSSLFVNQQKGVNNLLRNNNITPWL